MRDAYRLEQEQTGREHAKGMRMGDAEPDVGNSSMQAGARSRRCPQERISAQAGGGAPGSLCATLEEANGNAGAGAGARSAWWSRPVLDPDENSMGLGRLLEEREALLRTGVYAPDDRVLQELDAEIAAVAAAQRKQTGHTCLPPPGASQA